MPKKSTNWSRAESKLRKLDVWAIALLEDGTVELTTHSVGDWHMHGEGNSLSEAIASLERRLRYNPKPKEENLPVGYPVPISDYRSK